MSLRAMRQCMQEDVNLGEHGELALLPLLHRLQGVGKWALRRSYGEFDSRCPERRLQRDVLHTSEVFAPPRVVQGVAKEDHPPTHIPRRQVVRLHQRVFASQQEPEELARQWEGIEVRLVIRTKRRRNATLQGVLAPAPLVWVMHADRLTGGNMIAERTGVESERIFIRTEAVPTNIHRDIGGFTRLVEGAVGLFEDYWIRGHAAKESSQLSHILVICRSIQQRGGGVDTSGIDVHGAIETAVLCGEGTVHHLHGQSRRWRIQPTHHKNGKAQGRGLGAHWYGVMQRIGTPTGNTIDIWVQPQEAEFTVHAGITVSVAEGLGF